MNALVQHEARAIGAPVHSFEDMERMANVLAQSGLFGVKNPVQALALMLVSQAEGEHPMSVAGDYDIIQGKGTRKTHSVLARFQAMGGKVEWHELSHTRAEATFSHPKGGSLRIDWTIEQAKQAGLTGKDNWKGYARAMLRARLIAEGVRAVYPAAIGGWQVPEEAMGPQLDTPQPTERHMGAADVVGAPPSPPPPPALPAYAADAFNKNLPAWTKLIQSGKKTANDVIATLETKATLSDEQRAAINALAKVEDAKPRMTYAQVADALNAAQDADALSTAALGIEAVADEQQRAELTAIYERRSAELPF